MVIVFAIPAYSSRIFRYSEHFDTIDIIDTRDLSKTLSYFDRIRIQSYYEIQKILNLKPKQNRKEKTLTFAQHFR